MPLIMLYKLGKSPISEVFFVGCWRKPSPYKCSETGRERAALSSLQLRIKPKYHDSVATESLFLLQICCSGFNWEDFT